MAVSAARVHVDEWVGSWATAPATIPFQAKMTIRQEEVFAEMFEQSWRALQESFYDADFLHGANWSAVRAKYRPLVKHVTMKEDLDTLISLMMGELNASHLGISRFSFATSSLRFSLTRTSAGSCLPDAARQALP